MALANMITAVFMLGLGLWFYTQHQGLFFAIDIGMSAFNFCIWYQYLPKNEIPMLEQVK